MVSIFKRAFWPSFFILPALLFALLISSIEGFVFWWAGIVCLLMLIVAGLPRVFNWTLLSIAVIVYIVFLFTNVLLLSPAFTAKGLYFVCYLAAGFLVFARLEQEQIELTFKLTVTVFLLLSVWAVFQYITGEGYLAHAWPRVNTIFFTPNTFAAALNLVLLPMICIYLYGKNRLTILGIILILFGVLLLTQSRGGWLAFLSGIFVIYFTRFVSREFRFDKALLFRLVAGLVLITGVFVLAEWSRNVQYNGNESIYSGGKVLDEVRSIARLGNEVRSGTERLKIYEIAWLRIKERPLLGHGYNHFQYYQLSDQPLSRKGITTQFVHNDYLQIWMETGIFGLLLLLVVIVLFYLTVFRYIKSSGEHKPLAVALLAGMTAYFAHAMVDFVMYPPVLLLMFGAFLGVANSMLSTGPDRTQFSPGNWLAKNGLSTPILRATLGIFLIAWLSQPAVAQLAFDRAKSDIGKLDIESALKYFELARRFAPYEPAYYSAEADIWYHAAIATKDPEPARRADELLSRGADVNPYEVGNLFLRALLHREVPELLPEPASMETVAAWLEYVMQWHPHDNRVQVEYINTLYRMGRTNEAKHLLIKYSQDYPESTWIKRALEQYSELLK